MNIAILGIGSNIEPAANIKAAKDLLIKEQIFMGESKFQTTAPIGFVHQADFFNGAFMVASELDIEKFRIYLRLVESRLGRVRAENKDGPRTIDLDLAVWNGEIVDFEFYRREFLRKAVLELAPDLLHPKSKQLHIHREKRHMPGHPMKFAEVKWRA